MTVADDGAGIPGDLLAHVFDFLTGPIAPADETSVRPNIGLALVRELVHLHGGSIEARSEGRDRGSVFVTRWPLGCPLPLTQTP